LQAADAGLSAACFVVLDFELEPPHALSSSAPATAALAIGSPDPIIAAPHSAPVAPVSARARDRHPPSPAKW
jgi:hypothetical protein